MMNKGLNVVCSKVSDSHPVLYDFLGEFANLEKIHSVGRLDSDSTGLIFLTTDGFFTHFLESPETHLPKTYKIELKNPVSDGDMDFYQKAFEQGIFLPEYKKGSAFTTRPSKLKFDDFLHCTVVLTEGKYRQIRRMFSVLGNEVASLKRIAIGSVVLDDNLGENEWRFLTEEEVKALE